MTRMPKTLFWPVTDETHHTRSVLFHAAFLGIARGCLVDIHEVVRDILARATLVELRDAVKTADRCGHGTARDMFMAEIQRRIGV